MTFTVAAGIMQCPPPGSVSPSSGYDDSAFLNGLLSGIVCLENPAFSLQIHVPLSLLVACYTCKHSNTDLLKNYCKTAMMRKSTLHRYKENVMQLKVTYLLRVPCFPSGMHGCRLKQEDIV